MVEPLAMKPGPNGYGTDGDTAKVLTLVRQAAELGADVIKADPTDDLDAYSTVDRRRQAVGHCSCVAADASSDEELLTSHQDADGQRRRRNRVWAQRDPAPRSRRYHPGADGARPRRRTSRGGARRCLSA